MLLSEGSTNTSRSSVNLGSAWPATAWPPIKRKRVPEEIRASKNWLQSSFRVNVAEPLAAELLDNGEPFFRRGRFAILDVERFAFLETRDPDDTLNTHLTSMADLPSLVYVQQGLYLRVSRAKASGNPPYSASLGLKWSNVCIQADSAARTR